MSGIDFQDDKMHEECGVFGIYSHNDDVALNTYWGLYALQHRGQESCGIVATDGTHMEGKKGMGLWPMFLKAALTDWKGILPSGMCVIPPPVPAWNTTFSRCVFILMAATSRWRITATLPTRQNCANAWLWKARFSRQR